MRLVGGADGAAKRTGGKRRVALAWGQAAYGLHAAEKAERIGIDDQTLLIDDARKIGDVEETDWQALRDERVPPFGEALAADRGEDQHTVRSETLLEQGERSCRVGEPMQRHAHGDQVEWSVGCRKRGVHNIKADAFARSCKVQPALLDHGRREVGEEQSSVGIAGKQVPAEQSGAAAKLEHAGSGKRRQQTRSEERRVGKEWR